MILVCLFQSRALFRKVVQDILLWPLPWPCHGLAPTSLGRAPQVLLSGRLRRRIVTGCAVLLSIVASCLSAIYGFKLFFCFNLLNRLHRRTCTLLWSCTRNLQSSGLCSSFSLRVHHRCWLQLDIIVFPSLLFLTGRFRGIICILRWWLCVSVLRLWLRSCPLLWPSTWDSLITSRAESVKLCLLLLGFWQNSLDRLRHSFGAPLGLRQVRRSSGEKPVQLGLVVIFQVGAGLSNFGALLWSGAGNCCVL
mmetsp:Transcript_95554/g.227617  ORF Transcript_95554/g.227617 Transcript_95554/m.227617 type:complete len:250 (-) Transcript_95554:2055-2804(-)